MDTRTQLLGLTSSCVVGILAAAATVALAQPPAQKPSHPAGQPAGATQHPVKPAPAGEARVQSEHAVLLRTVGTWDATVTTTTPGGSVQTSRGTLVAKAVGEAWVATDFSGEHNGTTFSGHGVDGYDTDKSKFVSVWVDSASTELLLFEGTHDASANTLTMTCDARDPASGAPVKYRSTTTMKAPDAMTYQLTSLAGDGSATELMRIEYKRRP